MAERITGEKFGVYVKDETSWKLAVCTTSISVSRSRNEIEVQDNCTGGAVGREPSTITNTISFEGNISLDPGLLEYGFTQLNDLFQSGEKREWKIENEDSSIIFYAEKAFVSTLDATMATGELSTYSISLAVDGNLETSEPS